MTKRDIKRHLYRAGQTVGLLPSVWMLRNPFKIHEFDRVMAGADIQRDDVVLDLGCGRGFQTQVVARRCRRVLGFDVGERQITDARELLKNSRVESKVEFLCSKVEDANLPSASVDRVLSFCVLEHIPNLDEVLRELFRLLKPGGELHVSVDALASIRDEELIAKHRRDHHVVRYFTPLTLRETLEATGFQVVEIFPILTGEFAQKAFEERIRSDAYSLGIVGRFRAYWQLRRSDRTAKNRDGIMLVARAKRPVSHSDATRSTAGRPVLAT